MTFTPFGEYQLLERIGAGGMAEVFRARSKPMARPMARPSATIAMPPLVALKCIRPQYALDPMFISMFVDEARIAAHLDHKNITKLLDYGEVDGRPYLIFDHIHGRDLRTLSRRHQMGGTVIPLAQACYMVLEACRGLEHAHDCKDSRGLPLDVVHRDISPQNLLLSFQGELEVIDFGIARAACRTSVTERGWIKGKMHYMSPEQLRGLPVDRRSDLFALGAVLYELATGKRLFDTDDSLELVQRIKSATVSRPSQANPALPAAFDDVVLGALRLRPEDRYQSAGEFHHALMAFVQRHGYYTSRNRVADWMKTLYRSEYAVESARIAKLWKQVEGDNRRPANGKASATAAAVATGSGQRTALSSDITRKSPPGALDTGRTVDFPMENKKARAVNDLESTARRPVTLIGWAPARTETATPQGRDDEEPNFEWAGMTHDIPANALPRLPMPVSASDLADFAVAVSPRQSGKLSLPLPPSLEESGEISLGSLLPAVHHSPPRPPARPSTRLSSSSDAETPSHAASNQASNDESSNDESSSGARSRRGRSRWIGWSGWPTLTTVAMILAVVGSALLL